MTISPAAGRAVLRSILLGFSTGLRSQMGMAAVVVGPESHRIPSMLRTRTAKGIAITLAAGELLLDKYPNGPNRTNPLGLASRLVSGAGSAGLLARSEQEPLGLAASVGALSALGGAFGGFALRRRLSASHRPLVVALGEDAIAVGLATAAVTWLASRPVP